jgi:hypothetical protein
MTIGPGKYDDVATLVRERTNAAGVILIVIGGYLGQGFAIQATPEVTLNLPEMLRDMANQIEADFKTQGSA